MNKTPMAILSVSDKTGIVEFAQKLTKLGYKILSTGGTAKELSAAGVPYIKVADYTGSPEVLDGRVKTLHPKIAGGILAMPTAEHRAELSKQGWSEIDVVCVNLYPFAQTIAKPNVSPEEAVENIDIGGPTMVRAAAKNFARVSVVVDPSDYQRVATELETNGGAASLATRQELAKKAFAHTAGYDAMVANYFASAISPQSAAQPAESAFPVTLHKTFTRLQTLRYGENPHQSAAFYADSTALHTRPSIAKAKVLQGKELSYNNVLDCDAALGLCAEFSEICAVIVKHTNPCGVATGATLREAFAKAKEADPVSAFGGIVALNRELDLPVALLLAEIFLECIVAPSITDEARAHLAKKANLRVLTIDTWKPTGNDSEWALRSVVGGLLVQSMDFLPTMIRHTGKVVTKKAPSESDWQSLEMAWKVAKHVKSNAIVFAQADRTLAVGAGQMSRVDSVKIAQQKAKVSLLGSAVGSDAFFPFRDGVDVLAEAGASCVIQPGGSMRDAEVIAAADERGLAMVFTGHRHFRH